MTAADQDPRAEEKELAESFAEIARELRSEPSVEATLKKIIELAVRTIDGCDHAGLSLVRDGKMTTPAASDDVAPRVDAIQHQTGEGPCLDAIREHEVFQTDDLVEEARWPGFAARAVQETGVARILGYRLFVHEKTLGALDLYSRSPAAFMEDDPSIASIFAAHAAVALSAALQQQQMEEALATRDVIGRAKGILMARQHVSDERAFEILRSASQRLNLKLREVARQVAESGTDRAGGSRLG